MSLTLVLTRNAPDRLRGFLRSVFLEIDAGVYVSALMTRKGRERIWEEIEPFHVEGTYAVMVWEDAHKPARFEFRKSGNSPYVIRLLDGLPVLMRSLSKG